MTSISRRDFLKLAGRGLLALSGLLGLGMLARLLGYRQASSPPEQFDLGPAQEYPPGSRTLLAEVPAVLIHDQAGFSALSLVCTHLGCTLQPTSQGFDCPCHGSRFDPAGQVRRGPASRPLERLYLEQDARGHIILTRTPDQ